MKQAPAARKALKVQKALKEQQDLKATQAPKVQPAPWAPAALPVKPEPRVPREIRDLRVLRAIPGPSDLLVHPAPKVLRASLAKWARVDHRVNRVKMDRAGRVVRKAPKATPVLRESRVNPAVKGQWAQVVQPDLLALRVLKVILDLKVQMEPQEPKDLPVKPVHRVLRAIPGLKVKKDLWAPKVQLALRDRKEIQDPKVKKDQLAQKAQPAHRDHREIPDLRDLLVQPAHKVLREIPDRKGPRVKKDLSDRKVQPAHRVLRAIPVHKDLPVKPVLKVRKVIPDHKVKKDL